MHADLSSYIRFANLCFMLASPDVDLETKDKCLDMLRDIGRPPTRKPKADGEHWEGKDKAASNRLMLPRKMDGFYEKAPQRIDI